MARSARPRRRDIWPIGLEGGGATAPVGGAALLENEANGFAVDFDWPVDAQRVAVKTADTVVYSGLSFLTALSPSGWTVTPASINYSATAGSWWVDLDVLSYAGGAPRIIGYAAGNITPIHMGSATAFTLWDGPAYFARTVPSVLGNHKVAVAFANADRALTADGLAVVTDASAGIALGSPGAKIGLGCDPAGVDQADVYIHKVRYLPRRPSNAELVTMTI